MARAHICPLGAGVETMASSTGFYVAFNICGQTQRESTLSTLIEYNFKPLQIFDVGDCVCVFFATL